MKENEIKRSRVEKRGKGEHSGKMENWKAKEIERQVGEDIVGLR